jgi:L-iditol 2-dehydrogenase
MTTTGAEDTGDKKTMQALVMTEIGKLELHTLPQPQPARPDEVLIKVKAAGVCGSDLHGYTGASGRRTPPLIMGHEATGQVLAVGDAVTDLRVGERVAVMPLVVQNGTRRLMGMDAPGAYATHVVWPAGRLFKLPGTLSYDAGAFAEPLAVALHALTVSRSLAPAYETAFVAGAGTIGLLIAAALLESGVQTVIVSDVSDARLEVAKSVGAAATLNPAREDALGVVREHTGGRGVDVSFEAVGLSPTVAQSALVVKDRGVVVWVGNNQRHVEVDMQAVVTRELRVLGSYGMDDEDFSDALELLAAGRIPTDTLIKRTVPLRQGVGLFDDLLASPETIKCLIHPDGEA